MKPNRETRTVSSTLEGTDVRMGVAAGAEAHIMSIMTDMYEDTELAPIREYATNALDAHVVAGVKKPIEVQLPTSLSQNFRVRDYGDGLDIEDIREIYSQYGASTKRATDDAVGMLGIGCKSALTYTDQFTVVGVKNGVKTIVSVSRDADGAGTMKVLEANPTDEESGVEIVVPTKRGNNFERKARHFFRFWEKGTVLVNGKEPELLDGYELTPELTVIDTDEKWGYDDDREEETDLVVMGNVPYPANLGIFKDRSRYPGYRYHGEKIVVARVPIGAVNFTPSREALMQTKTTAAALESIKADYKKAVAAAVERDVAKAKTKAEALQAYYTASESLSLMSDLPKVKYKGEEVPKCIEFPLPDGYDDLPLADRNKIAATRHIMRIVPGDIATYGHLNECTSVHELRQHQLTGGTIWVTQFLPEKFTADQRRRLEAYREHKKLAKPGRFVLLEGTKLPNPDWLEDGEIWDWQELRKWRDPSTPAAPGGKAKLQGSYFVRLKADSWSVEEKHAKDLPKSGLFWLHGSKYSGQGVHKQLIELDPKAMLVVLPANRIEKFKRDFPHATNATEAIQAMMMFKASELTDRQQALMAWPSPDVLDDELQNVKPSMVTDPDLKEVLALRDEAAPVVNAHGEHTEWCVSSKLTKITPALTSSSAIKKRYPLLNDVGRHHSPNGPQLSIYLNAAYAAQQRSDA